jgi:glycyl-tRNA synthetase beta chain
VTAREKRGIPTQTETLPFLLEVGCEEIPARFLRDAERDLGERLLAGLREDRLLPEATVGAEPAVRTYSTPRRLVVHVPKLLAHQPDRIEEILGPPVKVAVDAAGNYTRAAESFAQKNSARLADLIRTTTPKGEYLALQRTTQGRPAQAVLPEILPSAILGLSFPKSMYWTEKSAPRFVRPIRWVLAVLGEGKRAQTVNFEILGVKSGDFTFGHRVLDKGKIIAKGFGEYEVKLRSGYVEFDRENRRQAVRNKANVLLEDSLKLIEDPELEEWIVNSTEWPTGILGTFDILYQALPREILVTVMRDHQKYFAIENEHGVLQSRFIAFLNRDDDPGDLIRKGHERVLKARFADALFFWKADQRTPLRDRLPLLEKVTYQAELGSYADKVRRMLRMGDSIRSIVEKHDPGVGAHAVAIREAIRLCKCDLTTQMVQEFPELQGIVGGLYTAAQGEPKEIADAIYDHYLPQSAEDRCPRSMVGAIVSICDKLDSVVAGFAVGHQPTSSGDPFALRRQGNGTIKVVLEFNLPISLDQLVQEYQSKLSQDSWLGIQQSVPWHRVLMDVSQFFVERLCYYLQSIRGFRFDTVRAVMAAAPKLAGVANVTPVDALRRAEALEALRGKEDLEVLCTAAKRIRNILLKSATAADWQPGEVAAALLKEPQERELYDIYAKVAAEAGRRRESSDYRGALEEISTLRPAVDRFFDGVLVMTEDLEIRQNRLRLLKKLDELFSGIAHFAEIEGR